MTYQVGHAYRKESGADRWQPPSGEALAGEWEPPSGPPLVPGMWDEAGHEHVDRADCAGVTHGVEDAVKAGIAVDGAGCGAESEAAVLDEGDGTADRARSELPDGACAPVALTDLPVVPIDPKAVLWAVEKMIEL